MRRIDKTKILSSKYKEWLDKLDRDKVKHPHSRTYYNDVVMNLLHCQKGVCAYTEMFLCNSGLLSEDKWKNGRYAEKKTEHFGELEHFDPKLKANRFWEWDNLFVIHSDINRLKRDKDIDDIPKPDSPGYDPDKLLEYDDDTHLFVPHTDIKNETERRHIERMIDVLQLNHNTVRCEREIFLKKVGEYREVNRTVNIDRFFTACRMAFLE